MPRPRKNRRKSELHFINPGDLSYLKLWTMVVLGFFFFLPSYIKKIHL